MSKFKASNGKYFIKALFLEKSYDDTTNVLFTLKEEDFVYKGVKLISLKKKYMSYDHIPGAEYEFASTELGGWRHWNMICNSSVMAEEVQEWRRELEVKLRAGAVKEVIKVSKGDKGFQAAKWLAEGGYKSKTRGRPSKDEVNKEIEIQAEIMSTLDDWEKRIEKYDE
jgi:hypothetical protein